MDLFTLSYPDWILAIACSLVVGASKCGLPGLTTITIPIMAAILPAKVATGALLPILIFGDTIGALYFQRSANIKILFRLMPIAFLGILLGYVFLGFQWADDRVIRIVIGSIVIIMLAMNSIKSKLQLENISQEMNSHSLWAMAIIFGLAAGFTTMVANAAGPVVMIYLLMMQLPKNEFIGTSAWYFAVLNWVKVPFMAMRDMITWESLLFNLKLAPFILLGAGLGIYLSHRIPNQAFKKYIQILTIIASLLLFLPRGFITGLLR